MYDFNQFVHEVRNPAERNSEGLRIIQEKNAHIEYQIAPLPNGHYAITDSFTFGTNGSAIPWCEYETREKCVEALLSRARKYFGNESFTAVNKQSQSAILARLQVGLFGFEEPEVFEEATREYQELKAKTQAWFERAAKARGQELSDAFKF